jgi:hypothetical protein
MFEEYLDFHFKDDRIYRLKAHAFYSAETGELRFRPQVFQVIDDDLAHVITLGSVSNSSDAVDAAFDYAKGLK